MPGVDAGRVAAKRERQMIMASMRGRLLTALVLGGLAASPAGAQTAPPAQTSQTPSPSVPGAAPGTDPTQVPPVANGHHQPTPAEIDQLRQIRASGGGTASSDRKPLPPTPLPSGAAGAPVRDPKLDDLAQQLLRMSGGTAGTRSSGP
jgi:hypothetical protein